VREMNKETEMIEKLHKHNMGTLTRYIGVGHSAPPQCVLWECPCCAQ